MNAAEVMRELELAMYELAEAGQKEKQAATLRISASKRISLAHLQISDAVKSVKQTNQIPNPTNQKHE